MNYEQANAVKHLAPDVMKVLERLEWECPKYKGIIQKDTVCKSTGLQCTGKIHYSWTPQVGEWCVDKFLSQLCLICIVNKQTRTVHLIREGALSTANMFTNNWNKCIPILPWEEIERVLEKAGLTLSVLKYEGYAKCYIHRGDDLLVTEQRKDRLSAVYYAVLALGKEMK